MQSCKNGHDPSEYSISRSGKPTCKACARERYQANKDAINARRRRGGERHKTQDERSIAVFRAEAQAGTLDRVLMDRLLGRDDDGGGSMER